MEAKNVSPCLGLLMALAVGLLSSAYALPHEAPSGRTVVGTSSLDLRIEKAQNLKETGAAGGPEWEAWSAGRRQLAEQQRARRSLDSGGEDCASATVIQSLPYTDSGSTAGAADNYNFYCPWEQDDAPDVVYRYTPAQNQSVTVDLCESSFDTKVYIYAETCSGTPVACNDDACGDVWGYPWASRIDCVPLTAGMTYYIVVDGFFMYEYGDYVLSVSSCAACTEFPEHDVCANAKEVTAFPYVDTADNTCAQHDCPAYSEIYGDVWYRITLTQPGDVTVRFCGTYPPLDFAAIALTGCEPACTPQIFRDEEEYASCLDFNPTLRWYDVPAGTYYYPVLSLLGGGQTYDIRIEGPDDPPPPPTGDFSGYITMTDVRPTHRRFRLTHESGSIDRIGFTGFCPGTTGQTVSHADSAWTVLPNGDGNNGDTLIFAAATPLTEGSIGTFVLRYPSCTADIRWIVGSASGVISLAFPTGPSSMLRVYQNTPNPFNPSTTIRFDLTAATHVRAAVFNVMGQEVAVLMDAMAEAGEHTLRFNAGSLTSGVYIYRIDVPGHQERMKMLLVK